MKSNAKIFFLFAVLIAFDQFVKYISQNSFCNKNIAWSLPVAPAVFYFVWIVIIAGLIYTFLKSKSFYQKLFLIFISSGAISNMIDRLRFGCVVDYIDLKIFPVFNLADMYITIGATLLFVLVLKSQCPQKS